MTEPPHGALERLAEHGGSGFPHLLAARRRTEGDLARTQRQLAGVPLDPGTSVVLMGSWGRRERTAGSDDDFLVLAHGEPREVRPTIADLGAVLGHGEAKPGTQGTFGAQVFVAPLVRHIGLDDDSNRNLTRRMLLVLESIPVIGSAAYRDAFTQVIDGYVADHSKDFRPPRFLLNDLIRYWRTICVDFAGKAREDQRKWGLRNAKLRLNRKLLFAGGLVPVLLCHEHRRDDHRSFLVDQLQAPPTDRLADAFVRFGAADAGIRALGAYDRWIGLLDDTEARMHLAAMTRADAATDPLFRDVRRLAKEFEQGLLGLLFETRLSPLVREFGLF